MTHYPREAKDDGQGEFWNWLHANYTVDQINHMPIDEINTKRSKFYL